jgi:glycosidase
VPRMPRAGRRIAPALVALLLTACTVGGGPAPPPGTAPPATATQQATAPIASTTATGSAAGAPTPARPTAPPTAASAARLTPGPGDGKINLAALYHMSRDPAYRDPPGPVPMGTAVTLRLKTAAGDLSGAAIRFWDSRKSNETVVPMTLERREGGADYWMLRLQMPATPDVIWYRFLAQDGGATAAYEDDAARDGGTGEGQAAPSDTDYAINGYDPGWRLPAWMADAVIYQIFPDRFNNGAAGNDLPAGQPFYDGTTTQSAWGAPPTGGNQFYGGDLAGITAKLDYLRGLGVTVLYLNPIFDAPSDHGYDTRDYTRIAPHLGTQADYDALIAGAKERGMRVILDGVFNHTGSDSVYFDRYGRYPTVGAYESQTSPYAAWYRFPKWPNWYLTFGNYDTLPQLQESDPVRDFIYRAPDSVAQRWLRAGAAGWRLDAAQDKSDGWWRDFRATVRAAFPDSVIIAEDTAGPANANQQLSGDEWDGVMNYRFMKAATDFFSPEPRASAEALDDQLASIREDYPPNGVSASMNLIDSHDTQRALTSMGGDKNRLRLMALLQFTSLGAPTVYYGDEAGLAGGGDPDDRRTYPWGGEDTSLIDYYKALAQARHSVKALQDGATTTLLIHNDNRLYAYARQDKDSAAIVAFNLGSAPQTLDLDVHALLPDGAAFKDLLNNGTAYTVTGGHIHVQVPADWGALLR